MQEEYVFQGTVSTNNVIEIVYPWGLIAIGTAIIMWSLGSLLRQKFARRK